MTNSPFPIPECPHTDKVVRYKVNAASIRMWCWQCTECGARVGDWLSRGNPAVLSIVDPELFDYDFEMRGRQIRSERIRKVYYERSIERQVNWRDERDADLERRRAEAEQNWQDNYAAYRSTIEWGNLRQRVFARANGTCEGCGLRRASEVHHLSYEHLGNEFLWELRAVCRPCHARWHDKDADYAA